MTLYRTTVEPANIGHNGDERPLVLQEAIDIGALVPVTIDRSRVFAAIQRIEMQPGLTEEQCVDLILAAVGEETP